MRDAVVIGAGIAGLAAAIRLAQYYRMASGFTPEDKRLAAYWEAKAAGASQAQ